MNHLRTTVNGHGGQRAGRPTSTRYRDLCREDLSLRHIAVSLVYFPPPCRGRACPARSVKIRHPQTGNLRKPAVKQNPSGGKNMSVSVQQILGFLRAVAPQELALDWDNVGLLVDAGQPVDGVLTALDITPAVVRGGGPEAAASSSCQPPPGHLLTRSGRWAAGDVARPAGEKRHLGHLYAHEPGRRPGRRRSRRSAGVLRHRRRGPREPSPRAAAAVGTIDAHHGA